MQTADLCDRYIGDSASSTTDVQVLAPVFRSTTLQVLTCLPLPALVTASAASRSLPVEVPCDLGSSSSRQRRPASPDVATSNGSATARHTAAVSRAGATAATSLFTDQHTQSSVTSVTP